MGVTEDAVTYVLYFKRIHILQLFETHVFQLLKEIEERRDLERAIIAREREALEQEKAQFQRMKELKEESLRSKELQLKDWENALNHERRQLSEFNVQNLITLKIRKSKYSGTKLKKSGSRSTIRSRGIKNKVQIH